MLEVCTIAKQFSGSTVLSDVSFVVARNEIVGFVGPNGAGKSTTMRIITGLLRPDSGTVVLDGTRYSESPELYLSKLGALIESPAFYPRLNSQQHLAYLARLRGVRDKRLISATLARVGLSDSSLKPVRTYSTGMKQRLGIAMAILHHPRLLVLDEPTNGLDPAAIVALRSLLADLAQAGTAVLISSHLLSEIEQVCQRVVFIKAGQVVRDEDLRQNTGVAKIFIHCRNMELAPAILCNEGFVLDVNLTNEGLICTVESHAVSQLAAIVVKHGLDLLEFSPVKGELERSYVSEYGSGMQEGLR